MATIEDVAKAAGVSKGTVSNVFSKKRPISKEVTERVLQIANQLNYKPNYWARTLALKETRIIGLNMPGENVKFSHFHLSLLNGVLRVCYEQGYRLLVNTLSHEYQSRVEHISSDPVDGEILLDPEHEDPRIAERLKRNANLVVIGRPPDEVEPYVSYVDNDNVGIAKRATEYLLRLGHRHILFLNAPIQRTVSQDREQGFRLALEEVGYEVNPAFIVYKRDEVTSIDFGYESVKHIIALHPQITAVITDTDKMAVGVYQAAQEAGYRIPQDLSVLTFSVDSAITTLSPTLTSTRLHAELLGEESAKLVIQHCKGSQSENIRVIIDSELVIRESSAVARKLEE